MRALKSPAGMIDRLDETNFTGMTFYALKRVALILYLIRRYLRSRLIAW